MKKIIAIGTGKIFSLFLDMYDSKKYDLIAICDNDIKKWGMVIEGYSVFPVQKLTEIQYDYICVTCASFKEIKAQIEELGVETSRIVDFSFLAQYKVIFKNDKSKDIIKEEYRYFYKEGLPRELKAIERKQEIQMILSAKTLINDYYGKRINDLSEVEFRVFSQNGEDGIIQWIVQNVRINNKCFVEFGVSTYEESNTRFLLMNNNWSGLILDGSEKNIEVVKNWDEYWRYDLNARTCFITKDNINHVIEKEGFAGEIGLLSVDIDGNDYWVLDAIRCIEPIILICEYNSIFGSEEVVTIPYDENFYRTDLHYSNLYYGASLKAFIRWAEKKNYIFLGCNSAGNNAFFVKKEYFKRELLLKEPKFVMANARESRDINGKLSYLNKNQRLNLIKDLPVYNLQTEQAMLIKDLYGI